MSNDLFPSCTWQIRALYTEESTWNHGKIVCAAASQVMEAPQAVEAVLCRYFMNGLCTRGYQCPFSHSVQAKRPTCKFFNTLKVPLMRVYFILLSSALVELMIMMIIAKTMIIIIKAFSIKWVGYEFKLCLQRIDWVLLQPSIKLFVCLFVHACMPVSNTL